MNHAYVCADPDPRRQPWCKVFAAGVGVASIPGLDWYIDGDLGRALQ